MQSTIIMLQLYGYILITHMVSTFKRLLIIIASNAIILNQNKTNLFLQSGLWKIDHLLFLIFHLILLEWEELLFILIKTRSSWLRRKFILCLLALKTQLWIGSFLVDSLILENHWSRLVSEKLKKKQVLMLNFMVFWDSESFFHLDMDKETYIFLVSWWQKALVKYSCRRMR